MRPTLAAPLLALIFCACLPSTGMTREELDGADVPVKLVNARHNREARSALLRPGSSADGDTTYVGFVPGKVTATNYWGIGTGNYRPYSTDPADYGYWGFDNDALHDNIAEVHGDSLFGWWPHKYLFNATGGLDLSDDNRPWWAVDIGNQANYVINQGAAHKRTFGVTGIWHRDNGSASGGGVTWAALAGTYSLWCGIRRDGDLAFSDPITGNAYNARVFQANFRGGGTAGGGIGANEKFPGYASQWDQLAYRDLDVTAASTVTLRFRFRTNMSTGRGTAANTRTGWFDKDPLEVTFGGAAAGNFISSSAAGNANAPIDSFMVYVGAPVMDSLGTPAVDGSQWFLASDGVTRRVYDLQRRWFSEVLRVNEGLYREVFTTYGDRTAVTQTTPATAIPAEWGDRLRVVFRSKTNRGFDDESGSISGNYSSNGAGAVVIDDVEVSLDGAAFSNLGDFEAINAVNNAVEVSALDAWKSTGKPPAVFHHVHSVDDLVYEDICGPVGGPLRICNMAGNVISAGDHDNSEAAGGLVAGNAFREQWDGIASPTINLRSGGGTNEMGINASIATVTEDIYLVYEVYTGVFDLFTTGNYWYPAFSVWPARQSDNTLCWSGWRLTPFLIFNPEKECFKDQEPSLAFGLLQWSAPHAEGGAEYPDSLRVYLAKIQGCFRFGVTTGCSPTDGCYWDNISVAFVDGSSAPVSVNIWDWIQDSFTVNGLNRGANALGSAEFDTTSAIIQIGLNISQTSGNTTRYQVAGDTTAISAFGDNVRLDLVFRVSPGPGNYRTLGNRSSGLRPAPTNTGTALDFNQTGTGQAFERNFWARYLANNGAKGSAAGHPNGLTNGGRDWSELVWNSARCDTAEQNLYTISGRGIGISAPGVFATMYEETDPKYTTLGIAKHRCFLTTAIATVTQANTVCDIALTDGWPVAAGYVAENGLPLGQTYEYTKILPDGQFTPGTHVQYFFRREDSPIGAGPFHVPDTNVVFPQTAEGSTDGHRWQQFSVLPDAWKKGAYGGLGQACMLYVDYNDRRGNERVWLSIADSIGATRSDKYGAHNGWHAAGGADINDPSGFVHHRNQQPGTTWDMYGVKGAESLNSKVAGLGVDFSNHAPSFQITNKWSFQGPSLGMLESYYKVILILTGDLSGILGPYNNYGADDVKILQDFMLGGLSGDENHRGVWIQGDGFVEGMDGSSLLSSYLHVSLRDPNYLLFSGNIDACVDLVTQSPITTNGDIHGIQNHCYFSPDVLNPGTRGVASTLYSPAGNAAPPLVAGVFHDIDEVNGEYWQSLVDGWDIESLRSRFCGGSNGRLAYYYNVLTNIFGKICQIAGSPPITTDVPGNSSGREFVDFMNLRNNPLVTGRAAVDFGLARADRIEVKVFDVSGRLVRTLADRSFAAGNHSLTWDGADAEGRQVARGVYFTQVRYAGRGFAEARKLTVLR